MMSDGTPIRLRAILSLFDLSITEVARAVNVPSFLNML